VRCVACNKDAKNVLPLTPARCADYGIPEQAGVLCNNCLSDIRLHGNWTGWGWAWLQQEVKPGND